MEKVSNSAACPHKKGETQVDNLDWKSPSGFIKGYKVDQILGATRIYNQILYVVKW